MQCEIMVETDILTAKLIGEIDHHTAAGTREKIDSEIECALPKMLVLDFTDITFMDSSGIGLIMGRYKKMQHFKGEVLIQNPSPNIYRVLKLAGMDRLAKIEKTSQPERGTADEKDA